MRITIGESARLNWNLDKFKAAVKQMLSEKRGRIYLLLFALGIGLLLLSISYPASDKKADSVTLDEYKFRLEEQLSEICSQVEGAGKCRVMVSFSEGESKEYKGGSLVSSRPPRIEGVTVLCRGADKASVRAELCELVSALYGIGSNRICILKLS